LLVGFVHHHFSQTFSGLTVRFKIQNRGQDLSSTRSNETNGRDNEAGVRRRMKFESDDWWRRR